MRVWKSVGAVAVYNRWRALIAVVLPLVVVGAAAFFIGLAVDGGSDDQGNSAQASPPAGDVGAPAPKAKPAATRAAYRRGYARGKRAGARAARPRTVTVAKRKGSTKLAGTGPLAPGVYAVKVAGSKGGTARVDGRSVPIRVGFLYRVCSDGRSICERPGT